MRRAGCDEISFGVETGNEKLRFDVINKKITNSQYIKIFNICKRLGIKTNAFFMMGFPNEDISSLKETVDFILELKPSIFGIHFTVLFPGSPMYNLALKEKKIDLNTWDNFVYGKINNHPLYIPNNLNIDIMNNFRKLAYKKFYFNFSFILRRFFYSLREHSLLNDLNIFFDLFLKGKTKTGRP